MKTALRYLVRRGHMFHFRFFVPEDLRPYLGKREIRRSLGTDSWRDAAEKAEAWAKRALELTGGIRGYMKESEGNPNREELIRQIAQRAFHNMLASDEMLRPRRRTFTEAEQVERIESLKQCLTRLKSQLGRNDCSLLFETVTEFMEPQELVAFGDTDDVTRLYRECLKATIEAVKVEIEREQGNYDNPVDDVRSKLIGSRPPPSAATAPQAGKPAHTLEELAEQFSKEKVTGGKWTAKTATTVRCVFDDLFEILGKGADIASITRAQLVDFRDKLMRLPANRDKIATYKGRTIAEILAMPDVPPMGHSTLRKRMVWVSTFFRWCAKIDYIGKSPAEGLVPAQPKHAASEVRDPYSPQDLKKLIAALAVQRRQEPDRLERFWIPLVALYSGMRLNEVCQLHNDDVKQVERVWCFDINANTPDKDVKTSAAKRVIPVHPILIDLGFIDYVKGIKAKGEDRLWPNLKHRRDGYGQDFSRWFGRFSDRNVVNDPKKVFHSFRHNFADTLKQNDVQESTIAGLVGHCNSSITTGRYGKRLKPRSLTRALEKLDYGLDLTVLKSKQS